MRESASERRSNRYLGLLAALASLGLSAAQSIPRDEIRSRIVPYVPPSLATVRTEVRLVEVPVVVRDGQRHPIAGLTRGDFEIYDDGKKQAIANFSALSFAAGAEAANGATPDPTSTRRPRFIALCFDDLHLDLNALKPAKQAAERFVKTGLAPGDRVAVVTTSRPQEYEFISDVEKLVDQIAKVVPAPQAKSDNFTWCPEMSAYEAYQIDEHKDPYDQLLNAKENECLACRHRACYEYEIRTDARAAWTHARTISNNTLGIVEGLVSGMANLPGQRMILLTSAGFLMGTLEVAVDRLMTQALHAEVVINTLDARGVYGLGAPSDQGLVALADGTGGVFYHNNNDLERGFRILGMRPEVMYLLSFAPTEPADGRFHALKVRLVPAKVASAKHDSVQARLGYTSQPSSPAAKSPGGKLDREVTASDTITDFPAAFTWEQGPGSSSITMTAHLDIAHIRFKRFQGRNTQRLIIVAVVSDAHGRFVAGEQTQLDLSFRDATLALAKSGFTAAMTIQAPPGDYSVRAVVQGALDGKLAAASDSVRIK